MGISLILHGGNREGVVSLWIFEPLQESDKSFNSSRILNTTTMKKTATALLFFLLLPISFVNTGCGECGSALCDLIADIALGATASVVAGEQFSIPNVISNVPELVETCGGALLETISAKASKSRIKIDFDINGNGSYSKNEINSQFETGEIPAGEAMEEGYTFEFYDPGEYRLITYADDTNVNKERDETNNASAEEFLESGRLKAPVKLPLIIKVLPNPDPKFKWKEGEPRVKIISRTVTLIK
jgi:hypothetical protein